MHRTLLCATVAFALAVPSVASADLPLTDLSRGMAGPPPTQVPDCSNAKIWLRAKSFPANAIDHIHVDPRKVRPKLWRQDGERWTEQAYDLRARREDHYSFDGKALHVDAAPGIYRFTDPGANCEPTLSGETVLTELVVGPRAQWPSDVGSAKLVETKLMTRGAKVAQQGDEVQYYLAVFEFEPSEQVAAWAEILQVRANVTSEVLPKRGSGTSLWQWTERKTLRATFRSRCGPAPDNSMSGRATTRKFPAAIYQMTPIVGVSARYETASKPVEFPVYCSTHTRDELIERDRVPNVLQIGSGRSTRSPGCDKTLSYHTKGVSHDPEDQE